MIFILLLIGYDEYINRNIPEDLLNNSITLTPIRIISLAVVDYGLPIALLTFGLEKFLH